MVLGCSGSSAPQSSAPDAGVHKRSVAQATPDKPFDAQLAAIRAGSATEIRMASTALNSDQLHAMTGLTSLQTLVLDAGVVRDADVPILASLTGLEHLRLRESPLTDIGLKELGQSRLDALIILNLPQAKPTAAGLKELGRLPHVRQLRIAGRQINDAAVKVLAGWPALTSLHLIQPSLSDESLRTIAGMQQLTSFYIDECPLSDAAWEELFRARPKLHVHIDQTHHDLDPHPEH
jgi:hypothetical protein